MKKKQNDFETEVTPLPLLNMENYLSQKPDFLPGVYASASGEYYPHKHRVSYASQQRAANKRRKQRAKSPK